MFHRFGSIRFRAEPDPNTTSGFTEAVARSAGRELSDEEVAAISDLPDDRSISGGLEVESPEGPARDESGRFVSPAAAPAEEGSQEAAPPAEPEQGQQGYEQGYLKALGEQAEKIGEERARREALEQRLSELEQARQEPEQVAAPAFPTAETLESLAEMYDSMGPQGMMNHVATSDPANANVALALWKAGGDTDTAYAYIYEENVQRIMREAEGSAQPAAQADPRVESLITRESQNAALSAVRGELGGERFDALRPHMNAVLDEAPEFVKQAIGNAMLSGDVGQMTQAIKTLAQLAEPRANANAAGKAQEQRQAVTTEAKRAAQVATGSARPAASGQSGSDVPRSAEEMQALPQEERQKIATRLVAASFEKATSTSVADGLTHD